MSFVFDLDLWVSNPFVELSFVYLIGEIHQIHTRLSPAQIQDWKEMMEE